MATYEKIDENTVEVTTEVTKEKLLRELSRFTAKKNKAEARIAAIQTQLDLLNG